MRRALRRFPLDWGIGRAVAPAAGSPSQASEFLLRDRVVFGAGLLAFQPLHVALNPRVVALLDALPEDARLPLRRPLLAVLAVRQLLQLPVGVSIGHGS